nr:hypothetical protein [Tanacetum cinerariifolium]
MPPKRDLRLIDEHFGSAFVDVSTGSSSDGKTVKTVDVKGVVSKEEPVKKNSFSPPIIKDWVSETEYTKNLEKAEKERDELKLILEKLQNSSKSLNTLLESQVSDKDKTGFGYKASSPAVEGFVNSSKILEKQENKSDKGYHETVKTVDVKGVVSKEEPKPVKKNSFSPPIIEDWVSGSEEENEPKFQKQV